MDFTYSDTEQNRSIIVALGVSFLSQMMNYVAQSRGMDYQTATFLFAIGFNYLAGYALDLAISKDLPIDFVGSRSEYVMENIISTKFMKYLVTLVIDGYISVVLLDYSIMLADTYSEYIPAYFQSVIGKKERNILLSIIIAVVTFYLYSNALRFTWAYEDETDPTLDLLVISWLTTLLIIRSQSSLQEVNFSKFVVDELK